MSRTSHTTALAPILSARPGRWNCDSLLRTLSCVIPGCASWRRPQIRNCASGNERRRLHRCALGLRAAQMFVQPRHDLDEIAGPGAVVELGAKDAVPAVAASAG